MHEKIEGMESLRKGTGVVAVEGESEQVPSAHGICSHSMAIPTDVGHVLYICWTPDLHLPFILLLQLILFLSCTISYMYVTGHA